MAELKHTKFGKMDLDYVLGIGGFDLERSTICSKLFLIAGHLNMFLAELKHTKFGKMDLDYVLGIGGFDLERSAAE
ncbi:hypothetical protein QVD17_19676 [Tagetes erecta]|uniref:Uncharacterized protein n=1 Tax=Tagetes erecta TaxID=13708 RepID=A0AAD8KK81_TARER|nr:hypothetical protein QVD17_19676 [Tagetes erecta]